MCDLVDSTALVERLGDQAAAQLMRMHDRLTRSVLQRHDGLEVDRTDGFLLLFETTAAAVHFAIDYQRELRVLAGSSGHKLQARVGIHVGEVVVWDNAPADVERGARPSEIDGLALSVVARLVALALPGQILLSDVAESIARRSALDVDPPLRWIAHGRYVLKGLPVPVGVHEVGETGLAPLRAPPASGKARPASSWWRRRMTLAGGGLVLAAVAAPSLYVALSQGRDSPVPLGQREWVVVGDFINVNSDPGLEAALGTAFRIGISESRFVNVVSDAAVRQALERMKRDAGTRVDRVVGVEIALREHARAVILPSLVQSGVRLRLVVEVIDPNGASTVWTQTMDAEEKSDLLPAMDRLLHKARRNLGESLQEIQASSQPLERVTTPNLEALRALSSALAMERDGALEQAEKLLHHAIELDSDFATAYRALGSVLVEQERYGDGRAMLERALKIEGRLTERERLYTRAFLAEFTDPMAALGQWRAFAVLYPDNGTGQHNVGHICYASLHDYAAAESWLVQASVPRNPFLNYTLQMRGHALLAGGRLAEAETQFRNALKFSPAPIMYGLSDVLAAQGRFDEAARYLGEPQADAPAADEVERLMRLATLAIARRDLPAAEAATVAARTAALRFTTSSNSRWRAHAGSVALRFARNDLTGARELARGLLRETSSEARGGNQMVMEQLLYAAGWAARLGLMTEASEAVVLAQRHGALDRFPVRARLATIAQAELELRAGRPDAVLARIPAQDGNEMWEMHALRARALHAKNDLAGEVTELQWMVGHPGRAYGQWTDQLLGQQARVLALVEAAVRLSRAAPPPGRRTS